MSSSVHWRRGCTRRCPPGGYDRVELVPEFGRLIAKVPASIRVAGAEDTFLGSYRLLVAPYPGDQAVKSVVLQALFQAFAFSGSKARRGRQCFVGAADIRATIRDEVERPFLRIAITELIGLGELRTGIEMDDRKGNVTEEGFSGQPDHDIRVLAERPQHAGLLQLVESFPENMDGVAFEIIESVHIRHSAQRVDANELHLPAPR